MDYKFLIGQEVLTKNQERGQIVSFEKERITVRFKDGEKIFNKEVDFSKQFLTLLDEKLNHQLNEEYRKNKEETIKQVEVAHQVSITRNKRVNARYQRLKKKVYILKQLFGKDFIYPPFEELKKQYRLILNEDDTLRSYLKSWDSYAAKYFDY